MLKIESLIAFTLVAKHRSFTGAANEQCKTPMALSKQISLLENELAEPLFERSTRKVRLTQFGEEFLEKVQSILQHHETLQQWLSARQGNISGTLRIVAQDVQTFDETVFPWLAEFKQLYPDIELEFDVQESLIDINHDAFDIYWGVSDYLGHQYPSLKRRSLWKAKYGIFASPDYLAEFGTPITPTELTGHRMIGHPHAKPNNALVINMQPSSQQKNAETILLDAPVKTVNRQSYLAVQGLGLINALVDNHDIKDYLKSGKLVPILEPYWFSEAEVFIYYQQVKLEQPKVRGFIDFFLSKRALW
ncbi:LysR family transcriptional regulator [Alteromonadaceae bacterium BrNp21-10]|nr:LysR family transcriptional regulator [Alteromonadaceae bacterium BrNp21-10]